MGLRTADEYRESLRDGRSLWYRGKRVDDILAEPDLRVAVDNAAVDFAMTHDPAHRELAVAVDPVTGAEYHALYALPTTPDDLVRRSKLIELGSLMCGTILSVKDVGSDALLGLLSTLEGEGLQRVREFYTRCRGGGPRARRRPDRREGRPVEEPARAGRPRHLSPHRQRDRRRHRRARRQGPHDVRAELRRARRAPDSGHDRCRLTVGGELRRSRQRAGLVPLRLVLLGGRASPLGPADLVTPQDARDPDRVRRRVHPLGASLPRAERLASPDRSRWRSSTSTASPRCRTSCPCSTPWSAPPARSRA